MSERLPSFSRQLKFVPELFSLLDGSNITLWVAHTFLNQEFNGLSSTTKDISGGQPEYGHHAHLACEG